MSNAIAQADGTAASTSKGKPEILRQPKSVWAVAFACVVSFMGIGLVDPILPTMTEQLHATPAQVSLLFTSYLLVTSIAMLGTGWVSSRIGAKKTLIIGLVIIIAFAAAAGLAGGVDGIIGFRAGWGLGNALFIATSLAVIVGAASGGFGGAIMLYEAALGLGIALGPLIGGLLGGISWRGPFFGVAVLMTLALGMIIAFLAPTPKPAQRTKLSEPFKALGHRGLLTVSITALLYNWGFFTIMGYSPYPMEVGVYALGFVFFGWGVLVAIFAVFVAPQVRKLIGTAWSVYLTLLLMGIDLAAIAIWVETPTVVMTCVVISGAFIGMNNTLVTSTVMSVAPVPRPIASAAYNFVRFLGGGIAPWVAGKLAENYTDHVPFYLAAGAVLLGIVVLASAHRLIRQSDKAEAEQTEQESERELDDEIEQLLEATEGDVIHGYIRTSAALPVGTAVLTLLDAQGRQAATGVSAANGYYYIVAPAAGTYVLLANPADTAPLAATLTLSGQPLELPLTFGHEPTTSSTVTHATRGITVTRDGAGDAIIGATVTVIDTHGKVVTTATTGNDGNCSFTDFTPGAYTVVVNATGFAPAARELTTGERGELSTGIALRSHTPQHSPQ